MCSSLKFILVAGHIDILFFFCVLSLFLPDMQPPIHCFLILKFSLASHVKCRSTLIVKLLREKLVLKFKLVHISIQSDWQMETKEILKQ